MLIISQDTKLLYIYVCMVSILNIQNERGIKQTKYLELANEQMCNYLCF